jgi:hypothetical protein
LSENLFNVMVARGVCGWLEENVFSALCIMSGGHKHGTHFSMGCDCENGHKQVAISCCESCGELFGEPVEYLPPRVHV